MCSRSCVLSLQWTDLWIKSIVYVYKTHLLLYKATTLHTQVIQQRFPSKHESEVGIDETLMEAPAECYHAATSWETGQKMADKVTYKKMRCWIPNLSTYRFTEAKRHCLVCGRGAPVPSVSTPGMRFSISQVDHFVIFITSGWKRGQK